MLKPTLVGKNGSSQVISKLIPDSISSQNSNKCKTHKYGQITVRREDNFFISTTQCATCGHTHTSKTPVSK
jgi:hypothetical protein